MKLLNLSIFKLLIFLVSGIILGYKYPELIAQETAGYLFLTLGCLLGLSVYYNTYRAFEVLCFLFFSCLGFTRMLHPTPHHHSTIAHSPPDNHHMVFRVTRTLKKGYADYRYAAIAKLPTAKHFSEQVIIRLDSSHFESSTLSPGKTYRAAITLKKSSGPAYPGAFNYRSYLRSQNICFVMQIVPGTLAPVRETTGIRFYVFQITQHIKKRLEHSRLTPFTRGILQALVLGDRELLDTDFYEDLRTAGGAHLVALSGLHIGIFVSLAGFLFWPVRRLAGGQWIHFGLLLFTLTSYIVLTGASPSVVRSGVMFLFLAYSTLISRRASPINTLLLSAFLLLLFHPWYLFNAGFQLSYAALTGILITFKPFQRVWRPKIRIVRWLWSLTTVSIGAQAFTAPIVLYYFGQLPGTFLLTNLLLTPLITLFLTAGYAATGALIFTELPGWFSSALNQGGIFLKWLTHSISFPRWLITDLPSINSIGIILLYLILFTLLLCWKHHKHLLTLFTLILCLQLGFLTTKAHVQRLYICHSFGETILLRTGNRSRDLLYRSQKDTLRSLQKAYVEKAIKPDRILPLPHFIESSGDYLLTVNDIRPELLPDLPEGIIVLLVDSAPVNLDRLIRLVHPKMIIADGSNYPSVVKRWKQTCRQKNIPFHHTGEKGYYMLSGGKRY